MRDRTAAVTIILLLLTTSAGVAQAQESAVRAVAPLPEPRGAASAVADGSLIYVFGGQTAGGTADTILRYDVAQDAWFTARARLPTPAAYTSAVWDGSRAYVFGVGDAVVAYDPVADSATTVARLPAARSATAAVYDGHVAWIFGGDVGAGPTSDVLRFDPRTSSVEVARTSLVHPIAHATAVWTGSIAITAGGQPTRSSYDHMRGIAFDPTTLQTHEAGGFNPSDGMSSVYYDGLIFTFGGRAGRFSYDAGVSRVEYPFGGGSVPNTYLPNPGRSHSAAVMIGDAAYVIGGITQTGLTDSVVRLKPSLFPGHTAGPSQTSPTTPTPARPAPVAPAPTARTPCYDLLSCPIGDVSSLRSQIQGVRGQVLTAAGAAVIGAPVLLLGEKNGALDLLSITQTLQDGSFNVPTTTSPPAYAATLMGGHVVLADLAAQGIVPPDGLLSLKLPVPEAAAGAQHAQLSAPELQLLADAFSTAKPFGVPRATPETPANIPLGGYAGIRGVAVRPTAAQDDARLVVVQMNDKGSPRIPDPPNARGARYFAVQLADVNGSDLSVERIEFEFEAPPDSEGKDVKLHHFLLNEQRWETVDAVENENGTYTAGVSSLSLFAVSTSQPAALGALVQQMKASPFTLPILGGLVVLGIAAVAVNRARLVRAAKRPASAGAVAGLRAQPLPEREALISDVTVSARGTKILKGVSFSFAQGEILALLGPSGSGKSTLLKALLAEKEYSGEISLFGIDPARRDPQMKKLIGYVSQETELYPDMTLRENVEYFGRQYGLSAQELKARVGPLLDTLGLSERANTRVGLLSGGQQRRASIAATLVYSPSLLILDEPTSGLDPVTRKGLWRFVRQASRELGATVIVTTHFLDEADLADRVVILNHGEVVKAGSPQELVRSLPGGGKAVVVELPSTSPAIEARVRDAVKPLTERGVVAAVDLSGYSARFFTANAQSASRELLEAFGRADVPVKQMTTEDCGMDAVFTFYAGERWRDGEA